MLMNFFMRSILETFQGRERKNSRICTQPEFINPGLEVESCSQNHMFFFSLVLGVF